MIKIEPTFNSIVVSYETSSLNEFECVLDSADKFSLVLKEKLSLKSSPFNTSKVTCLGLLPVESYILKLKTECISNQTEYPSISTGMNVFKYLIWAFF